MEVKKERCPHCGQTISRRKIALFTGMVESLREIYTWCAEKNIHEFQRKDIKHLLKTDGQIARFGDWVYFGGLLYKTDKGLWGMNMERTYGFLLGKIAIPAEVVKDPITGEIVKGEERTIKEIPQLKDFLDSEGFFVPEYLPREKPVNGIIKPEANVIGNCPKCRGGLKKSMYHNEFERKPMIQIECIKCGHKL